MSPTSQAQTYSLQIQQCIETHLCRANQALATQYSCPVFNFKLRGKVAGKALLQLNEIRINPVLFMENIEAFINEVIPHELAHLITYQRFGRVKPHGKEWQWVMETVFGIPAKTTHNFDVTSVQGKQFTYQCQCAMHQLSIRRHNKVQQYATTYLCKQCREPLVFLDR